VRTAAVSGILPGVEAQELFAAALLEEQKAPGVAGFLVTLGFALISLSCMHKISWLSPQKLGRISQ
jgi:hypothetical protein